MAKGHFWTEEQDAVLRQCFDAGMSCSEAARFISARFHITVSRNSCIGRGHRKAIKSNLRAKDGKPRTHTQGQRKRSPRPRQDGRTTCNFKLEPLHGKTPIKDIPVDPRALRCDPAEPLKLDLMQLTDTTCRWPIGGWPSADPITYCGHISSKGEPYCARHKALSLPDPRAGMARSELARANLNRGSRPQCLTLSEAAE